QLLLGPFLSDHVEIEKLLDLLRFRQRSRAFQGARLVLAILSDDVEADVDALVTDVDRRPRDQLLDVALRLVTEAATKDVAAVPLLRHSPWALFFAAVLRFFYATPTLSRSCLFHALTRALQSLDLPNHRSLRRWPAGCNRDRCRDRSCPHSGRCG